MATAVVIGRKGGCVGSSWLRMKDTRKKPENVKNRVKVTCSSTSVIDPYKTLRIRPNASEPEVKKAFRHLAMQYHPDVCRGNNCGVRFQTIHEAYDIVMRQLRSHYEKGAEVDDEDESFRGMSNPDWDMWEEWMGWEGAGIRDYSSHINPYA